MSRAYAISFSELGPAVDVGDGLVLPRHCRATYAEMVEDARAPEPRPPAGLIFALAMRLDGSSLVVTRFEVIADDTPTITAKAFHSIRFQEIIDRVAGSAAMSLRAQNLSPLGQDEFDRLAHPAGGSHRRLSPALLAQVADVVRANPAQPTKQVAEQLHTSHRNATRWIADARRRGLLGEDKS